MPRLSKVVVLGLDGLEPTIVDHMLQAGELPNLARLRAAGGYARVATTTPAQTPVAWSTFATGVNPGGHGIFDFLRRDPETYLPDLALTRFEQKSALLPPRAVNRRSGEAVWDILTRAGIPSTVIRCPCTFPPDKLKGRMLAGMGVPDIRGGLGTATVFTTRTDAAAAEAEQIVVLDPGPNYHAVLTGPRNAKSRADATFPITIEVNRDRAGVIVTSAGSPRSLTVRRGEWSEWLKVRFSLGPLNAISGMVRFHLVALDPHLELYVSPVNFDPAAPMFPISHPWEYAREIADEIGPFYTTGMVEDHGGLTNGRFGEEAFLAQCEDAIREREQMLLRELGRFRDGFLFCLFDTPDRVQHMFWRFREPDHPANRVHGFTPEFQQVIEEHYRRCDQITGKVLEACDAEDGKTLVIAVSDHGFTSFRRGVHLNRWLLEHGLLSLNGDMSPSDATESEFFRHVDWSRTRAYALGIGSMYLNIRGREGRGIVDPAEADGLARKIASALGGLRDPATGEIAVRRAKVRSEVYEGPRVGEAPDLLVDCASGYRTSWTTALGGVPSGAMFEDNVRKWSGDHIVDPDLVPGILFMNRPFAGAGVRLEDLAPTVLQALGAPVGPAMRGKPLIG